MDVGERDDPSRPRLDEGVDAIAARRVQQRKAGDDLQPAIDVEPTEGGGDLFGAPFRFLETDHVRLRRRDRLHYFSNVDLDAAEPDVECHHPQLDCRLRGARRCLPGRAGGGADAGDKSPEQEKRQREDDRSA